MSTQSNNVVSAATVRSVSILTYAMFFMFAMTTDAVGEIIKIVKKDLEITNLQAGYFHSATMLGIALSAIFLGWLADRYGRKPIIMLGLSIYGLASLGCFFGNSFNVFVAMLFASGLAIGVFKTAALALIGDIVNSTDEHTTKMNALEGFFGIGAIVGPFIVVALAGQGITWKWLYLFAAAMCAAMVAWIGATTYPEAQVHEGEGETGVFKALSMVKSPLAMFFSLAIALYVAVEVALFVWLPTYLEGFTGAQMVAFFALNAVMIFFILRAGGRFLGIWILKHVDWKLVMVLFTGLIFLCYYLSANGSKTTAAFLMPITGLFMSMIYPTLNSKAISCFQKEDHGAVAGLVLFFTAASAFFTPLIMGYAADVWGGGEMRVGFQVATAVAGLLFLTMLYNMFKDPAGRALSARDAEEYGQ